MKFYVKGVSFEPSDEITNVFYLIEDKWDDWFTYETMYDLFYIDPNEGQQYIGKVKIGEINMKLDQRRPNIPDEFEELDETFFSLGQSDYYYDNLNRIEDNYNLKVLKKLNDIAFDLDLFDKVINYPVTYSSLMRDVNETMIRNQFHRISKGGARLTNYFFSYRTKPIQDSEIKPMKFDFEVLPELELPTNIHVIIGRNGVGKTRLIKNMIKCIINPDGNNEGKFEFSKSTILSEKTDSTCLREENPFANVICVAFSAFDDFSTLIPDKSVEKSKVPFINIGLPLTITSTNKTEERYDSSVDKIVSKEIQGNDVKQKNISQDSRLENLSNDFVESLKGCLRRDRRRLFNDIIGSLENDPIFREADILKLQDYLHLRKFDKIAGDTFKRLSSGHKIILLTITKLIETVVEKSLVLFDEPEGHLHPPLLSAFIRGLSELLKNRNGVAIIATHSPVVLQEVPKRCAWRLRRTGILAVSERLSIECFGENIGVLTREVFGYEVTHSGFHKLLQRAAEKYRDYDRVNKIFNNELGVEAKAILRAILSDFEETEV